MPLGSRDPDLRERSRADRVPPRSAPGRSFAKGSALESDSSPTSAEPGESATSGTTGSRTEKPAYVQRPVPTGAAQMDAVTPIAAARPAVDLTPLAALSPVSDPAVPKKTASTPLADLVSAFFAPFSSNGRGLLAESPLMLALLAICA